MRWERNIAAAAVPTEQVCAVVEDIDASTIWRVKPRLLRHLYVHGPTLWIEMSGVRFIDSAGLGLLIGLLREAKQQGGVVVLLNPQAAVSRTLRITSLDTVFELVRATEDAPAALRWAA